MKNMQKREAVVASVFPIAAMLLTCIAIGLLWPLFSWWTLLLALFPIAVTVTVHPLYRLVLRPRRVRRFLRRLGVPGRSYGKEAIRFERATNRDFLSWENPLLALALNKHYGGYPWTWDVYAKLVRYDLGADWDMFFSKVWAIAPSARNFDEKSKLHSLIPLLDLLVEGKTNVTDLANLMRSDLSMSAVLAIVRDNIPVEYAAAL